MTKTTYIKSHESIKKSTSDKVQVFLLCLMCVSILIVSFLAFLKIENNLHALLIFICGSVMNLIIFTSGMNQIKNSL